MPERPINPAPPATGSRMASGTRSTLLGAVFLMATSAIGPGFTTQTTTVTVQLGTAFAFAIAVSIVLDIALQLDVWRVVGGSGRRAQELRNLVAPGLGWVMAAFLLIRGHRRADLLHGYRYPRWLLVVGWTAWLLTIYLAVNSVRPVIALFS